MENNKKKVMPPARRTSKKTVAKKRVIAVLIAVVLIVGAVAGSTLAWFTDTTDPVVNTFTVGDINIDLDETTGEEYKMIPGHDLTKDPFVTVLKDSEACYLFVKLTENLGEWKDYQTNGKTYTFNDLLSYSMAEGWEPLPGYPNVYYMTFSDREVDEPKDVVYKKDVDQKFYVLMDNEIKVSHLITKEMMAMLDQPGKYPTLTVNAYAIQYNKTNDTPFGAVDAWKTVSGQS